MLCLLLPSPLQCPHFCLSSILPCSRYPSTSVLPSLFTPVLHPCHSFLLALWFFSFSLHVVLSFCILCLCIWEWEGSLWFLYLESLHSLFCTPYCLSCLLSYYKRGYIFDRTDLVASDWILKIPSGITQNIEELVAFVLNKIEPNCCIRQWDIFFKYVEN